MTTVLPDGSISIDGINNEGALPLTERDAIEAIKPYRDAHQAETKAKAEKEAAGKVIRQFMEPNGLAELDDAERGLRAMFKTRNIGNERWDVRSMPDELVLKLARAGCLGADKKAMELDANTALRLEAQPFFVPSGSSAYLTVVEVK